MNEPVYTLKEIAKMLKISIETARLRFGSQPGVLLLNDQGKRSSVNGRALIRVPESVYNRVLNQMKRL